MYRKQQKNVFTYEKKQCQRQIDYALVDCRWKKFITNAKANTKLTLGSDHQAIEWYLSIPKPPRTRRGKRGERKVKAHIATGWQPESVKEYVNLLDVRLKGEQIDGCDVNEAFGKLEAALREVASKVPKKGKRVETDMDQHRLRLRELIGERKKARQLGYRNAIAFISKSIRKEAKLMRRRVTHAKIETMLTDWKGLRKINCVIDGYKNKGISCMRDKTGFETHEPQAIMEVFASFYEDLYKLKNDECMHPLEKPESYDMIPISEDEVRAVLKELKRGKCQDTQGIIGEMLQPGSAALVKVLAQLYTGILLPESALPDSFRMTSIRVLYKGKGCNKDANSYRPISILPVLDKVLSKIVLKRILPSLESCQPISQAKDKNKTANFGIERSFALTPL